MCLAWAGAARLEGRSRQPSQTLRDAVMRSAVSRAIGLNGRGEVRLFSPCELSVC